MGLLSIVQQVVTINLLKKHKKDWLFPMQLNLTLYLKEERIP